MYVCMGIYVYMYIYIYIYIYIHVCVCLWRYNRHKQLWDSKAKALLHQPLQTWVTTTEFKIEPSKNLNPITRPLLRNSKILSFKVKVK